MSSPERESAELAVLLARKAQGDAMAVREFAANPEITDDIIGFHAQQAIEKWLKAVIASRGQTFEHTHDIDRLVEVVTADGQTLPLEVDQLTAFTEYAVPLRYEDLLDAEPLNREEAVALVEEVSRWATAEVEPAITPAAELHAERGTKPAVAEDSERLSADAPYDDEG